MEKQEVLNKSKHPRDLFRRFHFTLKNQKNQKKSKNRIPTYRISGPENWVKKFQKPLSKCKK